MRICGIEISGSDAILAVIEVEEDRFSLVQSDVKKITLVDQYSCESVQNFLSVATAFFKEQDVSLVGIKKRATQGQFAGGAVSFKMEGLIQLVKEIEIKFLSAPTIAKRIRDHSFETPNGLYAYQKDAFHVAMATWFSP